VGKTLPTRAGLRSRTLLTNISTECQSVMDTNPRVAFCAGARSGFALIHTVGFSPVGKNAR
jgi:hypothetical protein